MKIKIRIELKETGKPSQLFGEDRLPWLKASGYKNFDPDVFDIEAAKKKLVR